MYSKERANNVIKNYIKFIPAGIAENVVLKSARYAISPNGKEFIELVFDKNGAVLTQTEYKPTKFEGMTDEQLQTKEDNQFSRMMQILLCFYKDEELIFNGTTFKEFANEVVDYLNKADKSKLLRVKIVYNDKGYTTLPSYAKYTFIEPMVLPEGDTSAIIELSIDQFVRPIVEDRESKVASLATTLSLNNMSQNSIENSNSFNVDPNTLPFLA